MAEPIIHVITPEEWSTPIGTLCAAEPLSHVREQLLLYEHNDLAKEIYFNRVSPMSSSSLPAGTPLRALLPLPVVGRPPPPGERLLIP